MVTGQTHRDTGLQNTHNQDFLIILTKIFLAILSFTKVDDNTHITKKNDILSQITANRRDLIPPQNSITEKFSLSLSRATTILEKPVIMKTFLKILAVIVVIIVALLIAIPLILKGKLADIVKAEANKMLNAPPRL